MGGLSKIKGWKRPDTMAPGSDLSSVERLDLIGITLLTNANGTPVEIPRLSLRFDPTGLHVRKWDGDILVEIPWLGLRQLQTKVLEAKGAAPRVELTVESDRRTHHFVVPNVEVAALKGSLSAMSARYANSGLVTDSPARRAFRIR